MELVLIILVLMLPVFADSIQGNIQASGKRIYSRECLEQGTDMVVIYSFLLKAECIA